MIRTIKVKVFSGVSSIGSGGAAFTLNASTGSVSLVAGSNITLQSNASTITISAGGGSSANVVSAFGTGVATSTGTIVLVAGNNITLNTGASSITIVGASAAAGGTQSFSGGGTSITGNAISVALVGGNNISLASASGAGSLTLTFNASSNALNNVSLLNGSSGALSVSAGAGIGIGQANSTVTVSASDQTSSLSYVAALGTGVATSTGTILLAAGNNITLNTGVSSITIVGPTVPAATNFSLNATSSSVSISAGAGIGTGQANSTITISASVQTSSVSLTALGNTTGSSSGTFSNVLNISGAGAVSVGAGAGSITISVPVATNFSTVSLSASGNTTGATSSGTMNNVLAMSGMGIVSIGAGNGSFSVSATTANVVSAFGTGAATSTGTIVLAAGANITLSTGAGTITIVGPAPGGTASLTALGNTTSSSSGTFSNLLNVSGAGGVSVGAGAQSLTISGPTQTTLVAGANISLTSGGSSITIIGVPNKISFTQNDDLGLVAGTIVSKAGTVTGTAGVGSSLFLNRINLQGQMSISEIDVALSIGFPATSQGAGTLSRSMVIYSFGNSTSLASVGSASATYAWNTGTSTAGASSSLTQFQGGWSSPLIQPMTFGTTLVSPGDYVIGQLFNFAQASSTWTLNFYGAQAASTFLASAGTAVTSASLGALSSGGLAAGSGITGIASLGSQWWPMMASQGFTGSNSMSAFTISVASSAATSNTKSAVVSVFAAANSAQLAVLYAISNSASLPISALSTVAGSIIGTSGSINAVTNVAMSALSSSTLAQLTLPNFGFIGTGSTTSGFPTAFLAGIMSTGAVPVAITLTSAAVTYSGSAAFQQPWFALAGS